jgi:inner membrane protein
MDNITHTLTGLILSRAGMNRFCPHAAALLMLAANAPDIDVVAAAGGTLRYMEYHRACTHALVGIPFVALLPVLIVWLFSRTEFPWWRAYLISLAGTATNPLLDWTNSYGVRFLWPFSAEWYSASFLALTDAGVLAVLLLALAAPAISRLVSAEIGARSGTGRGWAVFALCFFVIYGFGRYLLHERALATLDSRTYAGQAPVRVAAFPTAFSPFRWAGLAEARGFYSVYEDMNLLSDFDPSAGKIYFQPAPGPEIERARITKTFKIFLGFSQYPLWGVTPAAEYEGGRLVEVMDLRFGRPPSSHLTATAVLDGTLSLRSEKLEFKASGGPLKLR